MRRRTKRYPYPWRAYLALGYHFHERRQWRESSGLATAVAIMTKGLLARTFQDGLYPNLKFGR